MIEGLTQFRAALRAAEGAYPRLLTQALKRAGEPVIGAARSAVPHRTGALAAGFKTSVRGSRGDIVSSVPYAGGAEWGSRGKWAGFPGSPPRYVAPALEARVDLMANLILDELKNVVEAYGWFHR